MSPSIDLLEEPPPKRSGRVRGPALGGDGHDGGDGGSGGGGGGDGEGDGEQPSSNGGGSPRKDYADLGVRLALVGITSLFLVFLAAYVNLRRNAPTWPPADAPGAPFGLWASTFLLAASSWTLTRAQIGRGSVRSWVLATLLLGIGFLCAQLSIWMHLSREGLLPSTNGFGTIFYSLTGLHALHVTVGLAFLGSLLTRGAGQEPPRSRVRLGALYWHFMGVLWLVLFCLLWTPAGARP